MENNLSELTLLFHQLKFQVYCSRKTGMEFQVFFEQIMECAFNDFQPIKPSGNEGDWKSDGLKLFDGTNFQVYAPEKMTSSKIMKKIDEDFEGAKTKWKTKLKKWVFVYASEKALPPKVANHIIELIELNKDIIIETWGEQKLWQIVKIIPEEVRNSLFGYFPTVADAKNVTAAEVQTLLNYLVEQESTTFEEILIQTDLAEKLCKNNLGELIKRTVKEALPISKIVNSYMEHQHDPLFITKVARSLKSFYFELREKYPDDPDRIFWNLIFIVCNHDDKDPKSFYSSAGIVTYFFQLCDIFET
jgi:hypothetical protein